MIPRLVASAKSKRAAAYMERLAEYGWKPRRDVFAQKRK